jgi:hypothetical protein
MLRRPAAIPERGTPLRARAGVSDDFEQLENPFGLSARRLRRYAGLNRDRSAP